MTKPDIDASIASRRIGIFDSGIGGLTVVAELLRRFPRAGVVYFGDTARLPYGTKSAATVRRFSVENTHFLLNHGVDMVVVACNTSSAVALELLRRQFDVPILGVVEPGARAAVAATRQGRVGVIGTVATIESGAYQTAIHALDKQISVFTAACPLLVPLAEEGWMEHPVTRLVIADSLTPLTTQGIDTLVLGCTHYPVLKQAIRGVVGDDVLLVDSAEEVIGDIGRQKLNRDEAGREAAAAAETVCRRFYVSDIPRRFQDVGSRFLGSELEDVILVDQSDLPWYERSPDLLESAE